MRPGRSFRGERRCSQAPLGSQHPSSGASVVDGREGRRGDLDGQRDSLHCPCRAEAAGRWHGDPGPQKPKRRWMGYLARAAGTSGGTGRGQSGDARPPGGRPRDQGGDPTPQAGADRARRDPAGLRLREVGPWTPGLWLLLNTPAASSQDRPREGRISGTAAAAPGGRGGGGGRLARRLGERPGGPGLSSPQPPPLLAGGTRSGCARRGRKLSDLASAGRHSDSD